MIALAAALAAAAAGPGLSVPGWLTVSEHDGVARVPVTLSAPSDRPVRFHWSTGPPVRLADAPSALEGRDYVHGEGVVEIPPGETGHVLEVQVLDDSIDDPGGYLGVDISQVEGATTGYAPETIVEIKDDEPTPEASISGARVVEGHGPAVLRITRPAPSLAGIPRYRWAGLHHHGVVSFDPYVLTRRIRIPIRDDHRPELTKRYTVRLRGLPPGRAFTPFSAGLVADGSATVTVVDDDAVAVVRRVRGVVLVGGRRVGSRRAVGPGAVIDARRGVARVGRVRVAGRVVSVDELRL